MNKYAFGSWIIAASLMTCMCGCKPKAPTPPAQQENQQENDGDDTCANKAQEMDSQTHATSSEQQSAEPVSSVETQPEAQEERSVAQPEAPAAPEERSVAQPEMTPNPTATPSLTETHVSAQQN
ncbi:MAG: hypothetical protein HY069_02915 [Chlamydiia bacterium]|nr:hypothetical protein [Chlamydiia bacterium]